MRRAFAILSIIIFIMSMAPCPDCEPDDESARQEISAETPENTHTENTEDCSPFCCACCNFTISQKAFTVDLSHTINSPYFSTVLIAEPVKHSQKIWQPPRFDLP